MVTLNTGRTRNAVAAQHHSAYLKRGTLRLVANHVRELTIRARASGAEKYGWTFKEQKPKPGVGNVEEVNLQEIRRPLQGTRSNDSEKVEALMESIQEVGLQEPIDVLLIDGTYYGFSGCHRYEACQRLGMEKILAKVRKANRQILKMHFM